MLLGETFMTWGERPAQLRVLPPDAGGEILPLMEQGECWGVATVTLFFLGRGSTGVVGGGLKVVFLS